MTNVPSLIETQESKLKNSERTFLFLSVGLFVFFFSFIAFHNRFSADDYAWIFLQNHHSVSETVKIIYTGLSGRWTAMIFFGYVFPLLKTPFLLGIFNILTLVLFVWSIFVLAGSMLTSLFDSPNEKEAIMPGITLFLCSFLFTTFYFFLGAGKSEVWFWFSSMPQYIYSIIAFLFGLGLIFRKRMRLSHLILICLLFTYAGGAFEVFAIIFLMLMITLMIYLVRRKKQTPLIPVIGIATFFLFAAFVVNLLAPGNSVRASWLPERNILTGLSMTLKTVYHIVVERGFKIAFATIVFFPFFVVLGNSLLRKMENPFPYPKKFFVTITAITSVLVFLSIFIPAWLLSDIPPSRALALAYFFIGVFLLLIGIYTGFKYSLHLKKMFATGFIVIIAYHSFIQFPRVSAYSKAVDERLAFIERERSTCKEDILELPALPPSGMLYSAEISEDTAYWNNRNLKLGLELNFALKRER